MKVVRLSAVRTGRLYPPVNIPGTHFCYRLSRPQSDSATGRIMSMKNTNDTIANRTRDLPACSSASNYIYVTGIKICEFRRKMSWQCDSVLARHLWQCPLVTGNRTGRWRQCLEKKWTKRADRERQMELGANRETPICCQSKNDLDKSVKVSSLFKQQHQHAVSGSTRLIWWLMLCSSKTTNK
jgi:hypothetical protein